MYSIKAHIYFVLPMLAVFFSSSAVAQTAQEIADSVIDELNNVSDYQATVAIDYTDSGIDDMTGGTMSWKRGSGNVRKVKLVSGAPYTWVYKTEGGDYWNVGTANQFEIWPKSLAESVLRFNIGADMFNMEMILGTETWTKAGSAETVNSVSCHKLYTSKANRNYEVWIDVATATKVLRVKATDENDDIEWQLDYSTYTDIESIAQLPGTIVTKQYSNGSVFVEATYTFSGIDINEGIADSTFTITTL